MPGRRARPSKLDERSGGLRAFGELFLVELACFLEQRFDRGSFSIAER